MRHSDTVCRIFLGLKQPDFVDAAGLTEIICFPLSQSKRRSITDTQIWRISAGGAPGVLVPSPYAYQKASWLEAMGKVAGDGTITAAINSNGKSNVPGT